MRRRNQNHVPIKHDKGASLNLLELSETDGRRNSGLYWIILISMIAAYGTYMVMIATMERSSTPLSDYGRRASASTALESDVKALEKADREPIRINIPNAEKSAPDAASLPPSRMTERQAQHENDRTAMNVHPGKTTNETVSSSQAETPIIVHAMANSSKASSAARAILRRINEAAHHPPPTGTKDKANTERAQLAETATPPPLPEQRPYISQEIARHELSSQHGSRLSRPERVTRTIPSNIRAYRAGVRAHLAANSPSGGFGSGLVAIAFRLSADGKIRSAEIMQAPEAEDLDERALTALYRAVPFPAAPDNAAAKYRAFTVSFIFE